MSTDNQVQITSVDSLDKAMALHPGDTGTVLSESTTACYIARNGNEKDAWWLDKSKVHIAPKTQKLNYGDVLVTIVESLFFRCTAVAPTIEVYCPYHDADLECFFDYCITMPAEPIIKVGMVLSDNGLSIMQVLNALHCAVACRQFRISIYLYSDVDKVPKKASDFECSDFVEKQCYCLDKGQVIMSNLIYKES